MNSIIICNTPYQLFNAVNILVNAVKIEPQNTDVIIDFSYGAFNKYPNICSQVNSSGICRKAIFAKKEARKKRRSLLSAIRYMYKIGEYITEYNLSETIPLEESYGSIWVGDGNALGNMIYYYNKNAEVVWYDDGILSYSDSPRAFGQGKFYSWCIKTLKLCQYRYDVNEIYLNNAKLARSNEFTKKQLPVIDQKNAARSVLNELFSYQNKNSFLHDFQVIILGQVLSEMEGYKGENIYEFFRGQEGIVIARKHPREENVCAGYEIDEGKNMWELECINALRENHVLVSCCSTAQLTPKLIAQKEPYVIFLYKLLFNSDSQAYKVFSKTIDGVISMYHDKGKVMIPKSKDELNDIIKGLIQAKY